MELARSRGGIVHLFSPRSSSWWLGLRFRGSWLALPIGLMPVLACGTLTGANPLTGPVPPSNQPSFVRPADVVGGDSGRGSRLIASYGCGACHIVPGVPGAVGAVGPPLSHWAQRAYIAGALPNQPIQLVSWLRNPQAIEPGTAMPDLGVTEADARDMAAYLYSLR